MSRRWTRRPESLLIPVLVAAAMVGGLAVRGTGGPAAPDGSPPPDRDTLVRAPSGESAPDPPAPIRGDLVPLLLVPGWFDRAAHMEPLRRRFLGAGWPEPWVRALSFEDPVGSNRDHAREIAREIAEVRERTGAREVDVVAHSMGGLAVRYHLEHGGGASIRRVVFLGTPHQGTLVAHAAWGEGAREMEPGSLLLSEVNDAEPLPPGVEALAIRTPLDLRILPRESATLPGARNVEICCPSHEGLRDHERTFEAVRDFLLDGPEPADSPSAADSL